MFTLKISFSLVNCMLSEIMQMTRARNFFIIILFGASLQQISAQERSILPDNLIIINDVQIEGNRITKRNIILRELLFSVGDTIEKMELIPGIEKSRENLLNLSIFNFVTFDTEHLEDGRINLLISVTERWYIWPSPIFEHGERNLSAFLKDPQWNKLNYGLWLKWNNFRGRNELLNLKFRLGYREQYVLQYEKPNLGASENHKIYLSYSLSRMHQVNYVTIENRPIYFRDDEKYAFNTAAAFIAYSYRPQLYSQHRIRLHFVNDWVSDTVALLNPGYFGNGFTSHKQFKLDYVFIYDERDSKIYPLEGEAYKFKIQRYGLGFLNDYPYNNWEAEAGFFLHRRLSERFYFTDVAKGKVSSNKAIPLFQQNALGYSENMTGYDAYVIDGTDYFVNKAILKFSLVKPSIFQIPYLKANQFSKTYFAVYLNLLADVGYVYNKFPGPTNFMVNELQYSTGIGIDFVTYYDKVFGIEYAINRYGMHGFFFHVATTFAEW